MRADGFGVTRHPVVRAHVGAKQRPRWDVRCAVPVSESVLARRVIHVLSATHAMAERAGLLARRRPSSRHCRPTASRSQPRPSSASVLLSAWELDVAVQSSSLTSAATH
eukprot:288810-Rhodomonas_salina.1